MIWGRFHPWWALDKGAGENGERVVVVVVCREWPWGVWDSSQVWQCTVPEAQTGLCAKPQCSHLYSGFNDTSFDDCVEP